MKRVTHVVHLLMGLVGDFVWGAGNPSSDTFANDWSKPSRRNTGDAVHKIAQSRADFVRVMGQRQASATWRDEDEDDTSRGAVQGLAGQARR
jgi:hypothetical protein